MVVASDLQNDSEEHRATDDDASLIKDDRYRHYIAEDEAGIRWLQPGLKESSDVLQDTGLYDGLFSGYARLYTAEDDGCVVKLQGKHLWYGKSDLIAAVPLSLFELGERLIRERVNDPRFVSRKPVTKRSDATRERGGLGSRGV